MADAATLKSPKPQIPSAVAAPASAHTLTFAMLSHRGRVRRANQDTCAARPELGAFVICDGMGGAAGGEVASRLATQTFLDCLTHRCSIPPDSAAPDPAAFKSAIPNSAALRSSLKPNNAVRPGPVMQTRARLAEAIQVANRTVFLHSHKSPSLYGMGTTVVALVWEEAAPLHEVAPPPREDTLASSTPTLWLAHVGDSRCYLFRSGTLRLLTQDHSLVEEQVRAGLLSRVQAAASPMRSIITRAIGTQPTVEADIACHAALPGDLYLLTSDGLTRELDDEAIAQHLARTDSHAMLAATDRNSGASGVTLQSALQVTLDSTCQALVDAANANGGHDNITVLLVAVP